MKLKTFIFLGLLIVLPVTLWAADQTTAVKDTPLASVITQDAKSDVKLVDVAPTVKVDGDVEGVEIAVPVTPEDVNKVLGGAITAAHEKSWAVCAGFAILILIWFVRRINILPWVPKKALPWVSMIIGVLGYVGASLASGGSFTTALMDGVTAGLSAAGLWEALLQHVLPLPDKTVAAPVDTPPTPKV